MSWRNGRQRTPEGSGSSLASAPWSLTSRLIGWYACSAFVLVCTTTVFLYWGLTRGFEYGDDDILIERIHVLRGLLQHRENRYAELKWEVESKWDGLTAPQI